MNFVLMKYRKKNIFHYKVATWICIHAGAFDLFGWVVLIKIQNGLNCFWK